MYSLGNENILGLIPKMDSEEIFAIIALSKNLKKTNELSPKSTIAAIQEKYSTVKINQNLMMDWEFTEDKTNNWDFVFMTNENNQIGEYNDLEASSKPKRTDIKCDWIMIK